MTVAVAVIWSATLVIAYLALPFVVPLLMRIVGASRKIEQYTRETHGASRKIVGHLESLHELERTQGLLEQTQTTGGEIATGAEALAGLLDRRAGGRR